MTIWNFPPKHAKEARRILAKLKIAAPLYAGLLGNSEPVPSDRLLEFAQFAWDRAEKILWLAEREFNCNTYVDPDKEPR